MRPKALQDVQIVANYVSSLTHLFGAMDFCLLVENLKGVTREVHNFIWRYFLYNQCLSIKLTQIVIYYISVHVTRILPEIRYITDFATRETDELVEVSQF